MYVRRVQEISENVSSSGISFCIYCENYCSVFVQDGHVRYKHTFSNVSPSLRHTVLVHVWGFTFTFIVRIIVQNVVIEEGGFRTPVPSAFSLYTPDTGVGLF
jgi:hypothetical protein